MAHCPTGCSLNCRLLSPITGYRYWRGEWLVGPVGFSDSSGFASSLLLQHLECAIHHLPFIPVGALEGSSDPAFGVKDVQLDAVAVHQ